MFRPTCEACSDCGDEAFALIDAVPRLPPTPLCFPCFVERLDRVRACAVVRIRDELTGEVVVGARSAEEARGLSVTVADELETAGVSASAEEVTHLEDARDIVGDYHARELARTTLSESRHVYASTSGRGTVVDTWTRTDEDLRDALADSMADAVLGADAVRVRRRADIGDTLATLFPTLAEHRTPSRLGVPELVWKRAKERGVSPESELSYRNQRAGRSFEEYFRDLCDERGLTVLRGKTGLVRYHPDAADEVARKTDGLAGVPDFLVRGDPQRSFGDGWRPDGDSFVEVKRGGSRLSREQKRVVAHLKALGFDVYLFRGEPDGHRFERR